VDTGYLDMGMGRGGYISKLYWVTNFSRGLWVGWVHSSPLPKYYSHFHCNVKGVCSYGTRGNSSELCSQFAPRSRHITKPTSHHSIFTGRMFFLTPNQQCQSTEGRSHCCTPNPKQIAVPEFEHRCTLRRTAEMLSTVITGQ